MILDRNPTNGSKREKEAPVEHQDQSPPQRRGQNKGAREPPSSQEEMSPYPHLGSKLTILRIFRVVDFLN